MSKLTTSRLKEFRTHFMSGIEGIVKAGEIYVEAIDDDPCNADKFKDEFADWLPSSAWSQFEAIGRKWMHPRLIMGGMADKKKTRLVKRLPYSTQERVFKRERFALLISGGDTLNVDMMEATPEQVEQLCDGSSLRNIAQQKAWLESRAVEKADEAPELMPYTINGGKVSFRRGVTLTRAELKRLIVEV